MKYLIILTLLLISACTAPITKDSIRQDPAYTTSFIISKPYQEVFAVLLKRSQACYLGQPTSRQQTLVGNRDNSNQTGNITLEYVYAMAEHDVILMIDIAKIQDEKTKVNVYASNKGDVKKADIIEKWLGDSENKMGCA